MELRDILVTPIVIILIYGIAYAIRSSVTDEVNRVYFIPALTVKIIGALALGLIYQFYYHGGDTFNFHTHGSRHIWEAFMDSPGTGLKMLFSDGSSQIGIYKYSSRIYFFTDKSSYAVIKIASLFDLMTFSSYSGTAVLFAVVGFVGAWMLFLTFFKEYPHLHKGIAFATLFIPTVFFWGSGLMKDTITLGALGMTTFWVRQLLIERRVKLLNILLLLMALYIIFTIKKYILLCFLPALLFWIFARSLKKIQSIILRILLFPFVLSLIFLSGYYVIVKVGEGDIRYNVETLGETAKITAYDIAYQTGRDAGSTYALGELDGSLGSMLQLTPQAINVSLFRPYLWEIKNPLMLLSGFESFIFLILTLFVIVKKWKNLIAAFGNPDMVFCLIFSLTFAFAVGSSTFNFGTLSRYKIPLMPFYALALLLIYYNENREINVDELEATE